jgi:RNA polymerase sigma-70 factor (ECF subfamily)
MQQRDTETDWFARIANDDEQAFREVFDHYWPQVYGTSLHLTKHPEQAKDLSQEIFIKLWENRIKLRDVKNPAAYLYILSKNLVMDHLRKKVFDPSNIEFLMQYFQTATPTPQEKLELSELKAVMEQAVNSLSGKVKDVFALSRQQGLTHEQIAARLNISVVSSKTYVVRALQQIRKYLETHAGDRLVIAALAILSLR